MKILNIFLLILIGILAIHTSIAKSSGINTLVPLFAQGNASEIGKSFDNMVELSIKGKAGSYNSSQAVGILNDFFNNNRPSGFTIVHNGTSSDSEFAIGNLSTSNGIFKVSLFVKNNGNNFTIKEIRIE
jgi:hypothetical protein